MKVLVIGNKGSFASDLLSELNAAGYTPSFYESVEVSNITGYKIVIYIGGETRFENQMHEMNYLIPQKILDICVSNSMYFLYLSSLSVFGWQVTDCVTVCSERSPVDYYGVTKNQFDSYVLSTGYDDYCALMPASINSGRGRSSVEKVKLFFSKIKMLRIVRFPGFLSYIDREKLISQIIQSVQYHTTGFKVVSENFYLSDLASPLSVPLPRIPRFFFKLSSFIFGKRKALVLRMILRGIDYR